MNLDYNKIYNKLKNKKVVIYGAGKFFRNLDFDFSKLDVVGIMDKKFLVGDNGQLCEGYPIIPIPYFDHNIVDYVLIALERPEGAIQQLLKFVPQKKLISFVKPRKKIFFKKDFFSRFKNKHNTFVLIKKDGKKVYNPKIKNLTVEMFGQNNYIEIHEPINIVKKGYIACDSNSKILIGANNKYLEVEMIVGTDCELDIGKNTTVAKASFILKRSQNTKISIGDDCMISHDVIIRTEDGHTIYDSKTMEVLNYPEDVYIGNHVWIIANTTILKGSYIPDNCIVSTYSLVNKPFEEENCVIAGIPAKVVKKGINWDRCSVNRFIGK